MPLFYRLFYANALKVKRFAKCAHLSELKAISETFIIAHFEDTSREEQFYTDVMPIEMDHFLLLDELGICAVHDR